MNNTVRSKKQKNRIGFFKRLARESLILSCFNRLSERIIKLFSGGIIYLLFCGSDESDAMLKNGIIGSITAKFGIEKRFIRPAKTFFAAGIESSRINTFYRERIQSLLSVSIRFFGILILTVGLYGVGIYFAKMLSYIAITPAVDQLFWSAVLIITGIPMLFSGRSVSTVLKNSRFFGWLFIGVLGINEMTLKERGKPVTHGNAAFVLGTVLGLSTIFVSPALLVAVFFTIIACAVVLYAPETGLLASVMLLPLISVRVLAVLITAVTASYLLKVLRAKRNLRFRTADIFIFIFCLYIAAVGLLSGSGGQVRALYLLCFAAAYFLITNLIVSEKLIRQALYSFCTGSAVSCLLYALQHVAGNTNNIYLSPFAWILDYSLAGRAAFGFLLIMLLPICLSLFRVNNRREEKAALLVLLFLTAACIIITADSLIITAAYASLFLYILFAYKKPISTMVLFGIVTPILSFIVPYIPFLKRIFGVTDLARTNGGAGELIRAYLPTGLGIGEHTVEAGLNRIGAGGYSSSGGLFVRLLVEGGVFYLAAFLIAVFFVLQRSFNSLANCKNARVCFISAAFSAVIIGFLAIGIFSDVWEDIRLYMLFWIVCGMISAVKNVYGRQTYIKEAGE